MKKSIITCFILVAILAGGFFLFHQSRSPDCILTVKIHETDMNMLIVALQAYRNDFRKLPAGTTSNVISVLQGQNDFETQYLKVIHGERGIVRDPWNTPYRIEIEGDLITVSCAGPNGTHGDEDDFIKTRKLNH
jgi:hypothetical protein